ncbi:MAG: outer membrane beta-barrel protein [Planctomycetota bacterium]
MRFYRLLPAFLWAVLFATPQIWGQLDTSRYHWRAEEPAQVAKPVAKIKPVDRGPSITIKSSSVETNLDPSNNQPRVTQSTSNTNRNPITRVARKWNDRLMDRLPRVGERLFDQELSDQQPSVSDMVDLNATSPDDLSSLADQSQSQQPSASDYRFDQLTAGPDPGLNSELSGPTNEPPLTVQTPPNVADDCDQGRCNLGCEKKLFGQTRNGFEMGGWFSLGYHNRDNILLNDRRGNIDVHQLWLYGEKAACRDSCDWSIGYRADLVYGLDGPDFQAFGNAPTGAPSGWDNRWDFGSHGWALPQLYLQFANYDWDVKLGKFISPFGFETLGAPNNFFYSRSFTSFNTEPFTLTGILGERQVFENQSILVGATLGWDTGFENNSGGNLIVGTRFQPNAKTDLSITSSYGDTGFRGTGRLTSAVGQFQLTDSVSYVIQGDLLNVGNVNDLGLVQYLFREVNPCLSLGARLEWWKSNQFLPSTSSTYNFTVGANYRQSANLTIRPELRFDWGASAITPGDPIFGIDAVMTF